ncbi:hypothetical protein DNTS_033294 [Danionella cerebrum]|uniref:Exocyst complex component 3 n=1 Tax=Danionella cerebrum TaxID=2873325 RepID=A0A553NAP9_9TELE|nr:hypothetical protein DNTS_033294 [Danionella translucida]
MTAESAAEHASVSERGGQSLKNPVWTFDALFGMMALLLRVREEKDIETGEDIRSDKGFRDYEGVRDDDGTAEEDIGGQCEKQKHKFKIQITNPMKNLLKHKIPSNTDLQATKCATDSTGDCEEPHQANKLKFTIAQKIKIPNFRKKLKSPENLSADLDFYGNLEQNCLVEAQRQLLEAEERFFESKDVTWTNDEEEKLQRDYVIFIKHLESVIRDSFTEDNVGILKSAVTSILQEEAQDRRWAEEPEGQRPKWRPTQCRRIHDSLVQTLVEERLKNAGKQENKEDKLSTSLKTEVLRMGKQIQKDLPYVVQVLKEVYPPEFDICQTYAKFYHQAFSVKLQELSRLNLDFEDCFYILNWTKIYYPLRTEAQKRRGAHLRIIAWTSATRRRSQENEVRKWLTNALEKQVEAWGEGIEPELLDGYYFDSLAVDVLPLVDSTVKDAVALFGCESKGWSLMDYVQNAEELFSEETRTTSLFTLTELTKVCHTYLISHIHAGLKVWFKGHCEVVEELVKMIEHIADFKKLKPVCREELLAELHVSVLAEYVRRMMKRKVKLKDEQQQEAAAEFICHDSSQICSAFAKMGSREEWLSQILPRLSEILKLQDVGSLQIEVATLARDYPDMSVLHVGALLALKSNISRPDLRKIKGSLDDNRITQETSTPFFSKVLVPRKINMLL